MITPETQALRNELQKLIGDRVTLAAWMETPVTIENNEQKVEREVGLELARAHIRRLNTEIDGRADRIIADEHMADVKHAETLRAQQVAADL